jgi:molybdopterin molybdotransferase
VICGGVSVGEHDHVKQALEALGAEEDFWGVALRPGRPSWFGVHEGGPPEGGALVFGLPGNPVSAYVTFVLFVRPALRALAGAPESIDRARATLAADVPRLPKRDQAVRCGLELTDSGWSAIPTGPQGSHVLTSMLGADALAVVAAGPGAALAGAPVEVELLRA